MKDNQGDLSQRKPDFAKSPDGLVPVIIQDAQNLEVLMLGYMNAEAFAKTLQDAKVTFFSRSKNRLWTKGEESGNYLTLKSWSLDCDQDTILIKALPAGPTCHTGHRNCFSADFEANFLFELERIVDERFNHPREGSYVNKLIASGLNKVAQKVGEEGVETVIAALAETEEDFINEASDLYFHLLVLLRAKGVSLTQLAENLKRRHAR